MVLTEALEDTPCLRHRFCSRGTRQDTRPINCPSVLPTRHPRDCHAPVTSLGCWFTGWTAVTPFSRTGNTSHPGDLPLTHLSPALSPRGRPAGTARGSSGFQLGLGHREARQEGRGRRMGSAFFLGHFLPGGGPEQTVPHPAPHPARGPSV